MSKEEISLEAIRKRLKKIEKMQLMMAKSLDKIVEYLKEDEFELDLGLADISFPIDWFEEELSKKPEEEAESSEIEVEEK